MLASHRWLAELSGVDASASDIGDALTRLGLEVEDSERFGEGLDHVVVAEVRKAERVPDKDKLRLVTVFDGEGERQVICGAPNVPDPGGRVVLAKPGAVLPGDFAIAERKVGGIVSSGMLCSETELGIGAGTEGILVLGPGERGAPGQSVAEALELVDEVFEIGLTPNRPDCLGHIGLARELALAFETPFRQPIAGFPGRFISVAQEMAEADGLPMIPGEDPPAVDTLTLVDARDGVPTMVPITIAAPDRCPRYAGGVVQGVKVQRSPWWLRYRLHVLGVRPIDNIVDITNLVLFELGHPIHAFDLARVRGQRIEVRLAAEGEKMATLDGEERTFTADDLLICDGEGPVAVAGVMGGADSEIREDTRDVLIEVAYFDPRSIRRTSRRLGLHTDSSHRFERGVDPNGVPWAMRRAASLMCNLAGGAAAPTARDVYPSPIGERAIDLAPDHPSRLLGRDIDEATVRRALEAVGCSISPGEERGWRVSAPTWRPDLGRPEDLVEEVARTVGYDSIPTELPRVLPSGRGLAEHLAAARRLREAAADVGLLEAVNYAFVAPSDLERARVSTETLKLANPLSEERSVMRTSLLPGLLDATARARRHQAGAVTLFELARIYEPSGEPLPNERYRLAIALAGPRRAHVGTEGAFDFYDVKGALLAVVDAALGLQLETVALETPVPSLHPRRSAEVRVAGRDARVGVIGEVHPDVSDALDLDVRVAFASVELDALIEAARDAGVPQATELPRFPSTSRDVAFVAAADLPAGTLAAALRDTDEALVERVHLFDVYTGPGLPEGRKSLAFRVVYRDPDKTLTDKRVDKAHKRLVQAVSNALDVQARG